MQEYQMTFEKLETANPFTVGSLIVYSWIRPKIPIRNGDDTAGNELYGRIDRVLQALREFLRHVENK